jgi:hypothetical protein
MLDREACERRVYRLAALLTGNPVAATRVIEAVVGAQPDLRVLDNAHMDRLTVLRSREIVSARLVHDALPSALAAALAALSAQQREAWVLSRVYELLPRETARAMDCSVTATARHLEQADALMGRATGGEWDQAAQALLSYALSLDVPDFYRQRQRRRRRIRLIMRIAAIVLLMALVTAAFAIVAHRFFLP